MSSCLHIALWVIFGIFVCVCVGRANEVGTDVFPVKSHYCLLVLHVHTCTHTHSWVRLSSVCVCVSQESRRRTMSVFIKQKENEAHPFTIADV